jgi:hypothetical protein
VFYICLLDRWPVAREETNEQESKGEKESEEDRRKGKEKHWEKEDTT